MLGRDKVEKLVNTAFVTLEEENQDDAVVGVVMITMEIRGMGDNTVWYVFCNDKRTWVQEAAVREAGMAVGYSEVEDGDS